VDVGTVGDVEAFKRRQREDYQRRLEQSLDVDDEQDEYESEVEEGIDGEEGWTNAEGDRLRDFGVDEDAELLAEEDVPLGELLRRRKARAFT
jgi:palmitoyltransferase